MSYQFTPDQAGPPRSTPIPGDGNIPGNAGYQVAPTPSQFLGGSSTPETPKPPKPPKSGPGWGFRLLMLLIILSVVGGIGAAVWGVMQGVDAVNTASDIADPDLSDDDLEALNLSSDEEFLYNGDAARAVAEALDDAIPGEPTQFNDISVFGDYALATAQDPDVPGRFDRYTWRSGTVGAPTPEPDDPEGANVTFTVDEIDWEAITNIVDQAPELTQVEDGAVDYFIVSRDAFIDIEDVKVRIYVNGPRGSAVIEATADGTVTRIF